MTISASVNTDQTGRVYVCDLSGTPYITNELTAVKTVSVNQSQYEILLKAVPKNGYKFKYWELSGINLDRTIYPVARYTSDQFRWSMGRGHRHFKAIFEPNYIWKLELSAVSLSAYTKFISNCQNYVSYKETGCNPYNIDISSYILPKQINTIVTFTNYPSVSEKDARYTVYKATTKQ